MQFSLNPLKWFTRESSGALNPSSWLVSLWGGTETNSGETVNSFTALESNTVFACVDLISKTLSTLPWHHKQDENILESTPLERILTKKVNNNMSSVSFKRAFMSNLLTKGESFALPQRRGTQLHSIEFLANTQVQKEDKNGKLIYNVTLSNQRTIQLESHQIIHVMAFTLDGWNGISPIDFAKQTIGADIAATKHLGNFYGKGATPKGYIKLMGNIRDATRLQEIGSRFDQDYSGSDNSNKTAVIPEGGEYVPLTSSMSDSQFNESQKWNSEQICRVFGVPPYKVGRSDAAAYNVSIEAQNHPFVQDCIRPWAEILEAEFSLKLINQSDQYIEIDFARLLRGDTEAQTQRDVSYWNVGVLNANEIRKSQGLPSREGGDEYFSPGHMSNQNDINNGKEERPELQSS